MKIGAAAANVLRCTGVVGDGRNIAVAAHDFLNYHSIRAAGDGGPGENPDAATGLYISFEPGAGKGFADDVEPRGQKQEVFVADRITVHGGDVGGRRIDAGDHWLCQDPAGGLRNRHDLNANRFCIVANDRRCLVEANHAAVQRPEVPPDFSVTRMPSISIVRSTAFSMSNSVRQATDTAVSASISTPV